MEGNTVTMTEPKGRAEKSYNYNKCFWSHDNAEGRSIFSNKDLFESVGVEMLNNSYEGFNATVFAYGQTGSGKSYSVEGCPQDVGILQQVCEALFLKKTEVEAANPENQLKVTVSYLEIYNEKLKDLLDAQRDKQLKIYQTKKQGIFVKGLEKVYCGNFGEVEKLLADGKKMRVVGSTLMNKQSSRSHAVFTLYMSFKEVTGSKKTVKDSEIHIVDLAGSERQEKTKATGARLKEGSNINKSLTYLGIVIEKLSKQKKKGGDHIPF